MQPLKKYLLVGFPIQPKYGPDTNLLFQEHTQNLPPATKCDTQGVITKVGPVVWDSLPPALYREQPLLEEGKS